MATPYQTSKAEWDAVAAEFYEYFITYLRSKATPVDGVETYSPSDYTEFAQRVKSLPARYDFQGVRKTVLVPLEILGRDAQESAQKAKDAADKAESAAKNAEDAAKKANSSAQKADESALKADNSAEKAEKAAAVANTSANEADLAAEKARETDERLKANEAIREQNETLREEAFQKALDQFKTESSDLIKGFKDFDELARQKWEEFTADASKTQEEVRSNLEKMKTALEESGEINNRFKALLDNPPRIMGDPATWWLYSEETGEYIDTGMPASGRSPYLEVQSMHWMQWNDKKGKYEDSGISATFPDIDFIDADEFEEIWKNI